jgi:hypothetical protein
MVVETLLWCRTVNTKQTNRNGSKTRLNLLNDPDQTVAHKHRTRSKKSRAKEQVRLRRVGVGVSEVSGVWTRSGISNNANPLSTRNVPMFVVWKDWIPTTRAGRIHSVALEASACCNPSLGGACCTRSSRPIAATVCC